MSETLVPKFKTAYSPSSSRPYDVSVSINPSLTKQAFKRECDINTIMIKYQKTGLIEHNNSVDGRYGDFVTSTDYHEAMNDILSVQEAFASLPSAIRSRFENDPAGFLDFTQNPENHDEMRELGLITPPAPIVRPDDPPAVQPEPAPEPAPEPVV